MKINRLINILLYLNRNKKITATDLSRDFEVSIRTIYRDLDILEAAGIPIERLQGNGGGISLLDTYRLDDGAFSKNEIVRILEVFEKSTFKDELNSLLIEKIKNLLSESEIKELKKMDYIKIEKMHTRQEDIKDEIALIKKMIEKNHIMKIKYVNSAGEISEREVEPYLLSFYNKKFYLYAYCLLKKQLRFFKVSRISDITTSKNKFEIRNDVLDEIHSAKGFLFEKNTDIIILKTSVENFEKIKNIFCKDEILEDESILKKYLSKESMNKKEVFVLLNWKIDQYVTSFLLSLGNNVKVIYPDDLVNKIRKEIVDMGKIY